MIYEFVCHDCRIRTDVERPPELAGELASCPVCNEPMVRVFYAPALLGRSKPRPFKFDPKLAALDGEHSVAQSFRLAESRGAEELRRVMKHSGPAEAAAARSYLKENFA